MTPEEVSKIMLTEEEREIGSKDLIHKLAKQVTQDSKILKGINAWKDNTDNWKDNHFTVNKQEHDQILELTK